MHADVGFMHSFVDMVDCCIAMAMELAFRMLHMLFCAMQRLERMFDPRMGWWNRGCRSNWEGHG